MPVLKFLEWNMEWLNDLFAAEEGPPAFRSDDAHPQHAARGVTVAERRADLKGAIEKLDPDLVVVVEGPSRPEELALLFDGFRPNAWKTHLQETDGSTQNVGIAVRTDRGLLAAEPLEPVDTRNRAEFKEFTHASDDSGVKEVYRFERSPLLVHVKLADGNVLTVLGLHLKSKAIFDALEWSRWWERADGNRRKILAQAARVRDAFVDPFLRDAGTRGRPLIVCGDINDGPGLDASEKRLYASGVERLMGDVWRPETTLRNAVFDALPPSRRSGLTFAGIYTTRYRDPIFNDTTHEEWIDHLLHSQNVTAGWVRNASIVTKIADKEFDRVYPHASDHFPVIAEIVL